ncbi:class F sortase [Isoptericola sp. NPDC019693]|uniref:class F sortase n=1 Tax=Isoptericola sp. NPDC019693 TaxID=3364009 RepID=UPI00379C0D46
MTSHARSAAAREVGTAASRAVAVALALVLSACAPPAEHRPVAVQDPPPQVTSTPAASPGAAPAGGVARVPVRPARDVPAPPPAAPTRVEVPALDLDVRVRAVGVDEQGRMDLPGSADVAGWYRFGSAPASTAGATVVAAHVDDEDSVGPFARLVAAEPGTTVRVRTSDGATHTYTVERSESTAKADVATDRLFDRSGRPRLLLVTCGGRWDADARSYTDNVVVTAVPRR